MANSELHEHAPHLSVVEARGASRGRHILMVLIASVVLAGAALALAWGFRAGDFNRADSSAASRIAASSPSVVPANQAPPAAAARTPATTGLNQ